MPATGSPARGRGAYREHFVALEGRLGPYDQVSRAFAATVAAAYVEWKACSEALEEARQKREHGLGRRPSVAAITRLQRRLGLALADYSQGLSRLQELCASSRDGQPSPSPSELLRQARREAGLDV